MSTDVKVEVAIARPRATAVAIDALLQLLEISR
jgi:hypothetical protein